MTKSIGVFETGRPSDDLMAIHSDYVHMVCDWLGFDSHDCRRVATWNNEAPPDPDDAMLWVITGSKAGVYEDHPWIPPLEEFIRECQARSTPMVGICFGHQLIAQALGGVVRNSPKGWGLGVHSYEPTGKAEGVEGLAVPFALQAIHQDQIEQLPPKAVTLAQSEFCDFAAVYYPDFAITFQGHPEFNASYARDLIKARRNVAWPESVADPALKTLETQTHAGKLAEAIHDWLRQRENSDQSNTPKKT